MRRALAGLGLSLAAHGAIVLALLGLWPSAPSVREQASTPTEMRMGVMQVETQRAAVTAPEAPRAQSAPSAGARTTGQGVPTLRGRAVEADGAPVAAVVGLGARASAAVGAGQRAPQVAAPSASASPVSISSDVAPAADLEAGHARQTAPSSRIQEASAPSSVAVATGTIQAESGEALPVSAPLQAPTFSPASSSAPSVAPKAPVSAAGRLTSQAALAVDASTESASATRPNQTVVPELGPEATVAPRAAMAALRSEAQPPEATSGDAQPLDATPREAQIPDATLSEAQTLAAMSSEPLTLDATSSAARTPETTFTEEQRPEQIAVPSAPAAPVIVSPRAARSERTASVPPAAKSTPQVRPALVIASSSAPDSTVVRADAGRAVAAPQATAVGTAVSTMRLAPPGVAASRPWGRRVTAALDWSGAGALRLDAGGLATLRAFLTPEASQGWAVRDGMADALGAADCARVRTVFDPETGALALRGHVPAPEASAPLIAALRAEIGETLPLRDELRVLPDPQCGLLDGLDRLGLPQSEEQLTNPNIVGENAFVREYDFTEGEWFVVELGTPDYPAYLYVDYFDSDGQVLHLTPNASLPLVSYQPDSPVVIGRDGALRLRIAPPFGQDIVVAFAASAPLYDGLRPTAEPAGPYLDWLRERVASARVQDPSFKGEWVYLFVASHAAPE